MKTKGILQCIRERAKGRKRWGGEHLGSEDTYCARGVVGHPTPHTLQRSTHPQVPILKTNLPAIADTESKHPSCTLVSRSALYPPRKIHVARSQIPILNNSLSILHPATGELSESEIHRGFPSQDKCCCERERERALAFFHYWKQRQTNCVMTAARFHHPLPNFARHREKAKGITLESLHG
jgi:hypothetical protein